MATQTIVTAGQGKLTTRDWLMGLLMAVGSPVIAIIWDCIEKGNFKFDWGMLAKVAGSAAAMYIFKNLSDKSKIVVTGASDELIKAVKDGAKEVRVGNVVAEVKK